ncbi:MAG: NADH-ubiquinone oxidoreductase-F iron-sulfur binding region domain-containing protein [bacterium]
MDFEKIRQTATMEWDIFANSKKPVILVGAGTCGRAAGALSLIDNIKQELQSNGIDAIVMQVGCIGLCYLEPLVDIIKPGQSRISYGRVTPEIVATLIKNYLVNDDPCPEFAIGSIGEKNIPGIPLFFEHPMLKSQVRIVLRKCGFIDPENINHYIANDGYSALSKALKMSPDDVIAEVKSAGLRGRGGSGFLTANKWNICRKQISKEKYIICNADEGDPGAFMNRALWESDPHSVLEGILIAGYAIGANMGYVYIRAEYPLAIERLKIGLKQMQEYNLIGENILGSGFNFDINIKEGAGAFVCGEETALIASLEGKRGMPRARPPYPAVSGLYNKPTVINNVETLGTIPYVILKGAENYSKYGTKTSKGTKTFALAGKMKRTGLIEVPMGMTLKEIVYDIGGGILDDKAFKGIQTGGPSGGCLPESCLTLPIDYESLKEAGSIMGSGGMIVMDENNCMVDIAHYFLDFTQAESCGKCVPCRVGIKEMLKILDKIKTGMGTMEDIDKLEELAHTIKSTALCGLGQTAPNPALSTLKYFREEYINHIKNKRCEALVCKEIISSPCQHTCPIDTEAPAYIALVAQGKIKEAFDIIHKDNPLPSVCGRVCHHPCEVKCKAGDGGEPIAIRGIKRFVTDYAMKSGLKPKISLKKNKSQKVAIIGAGPTGLSCGYYLRLEGYDVTIYEALPIAGGMLTSVIPEYRLPRKVFEFDIEAIKSAGVEIQTNVKLGKDITIDGLLAQGYKAIFIATGSHKSIKLRIPGEDAEGVIDSLEFLKSINSGKKIKTGKRIGVIGGGNSAIDAARVANRLPDTEKVTIIYRRTIAEMPAFKEEIESAIEEGIEIKYLTAPTRVITQKGKLAGISCIKMELGDIDNSGRRRPVKIKGSQFKMELDTLLTAISEQPDTSYINKKDNIHIGEWSNVIADKEVLITSRDGIFAGGDVVTGPATVVEAISAGKRAAKSIDKYLRGESLTGEYKVTRPSIYPKPVELSETEITEAKRPAMPLLSVKDRNNNFKEVSLGFTKDVIIKEARRCLRCDLETEDGKKSIEKKND